MKKLIMTIAIVLAMGLGAYAQEGGLLNRGVNFDKQEKGSMGKGTLGPGMPGHGETGDQDATPLGSGVAVLLGLGTAYLIGKKRNEE